MIQTIAAFLNNNSKKKLRNYCIKFNFVQKKYFYMQIVKNCNFTTMTFGYKYKVNVSVRFAYNKELSNKTLIHVKYICILKVQL